MMGQRSTSLATAILFAAASGIGLAWQTEQPKVPPTGNRREPGFFGGVGQKKDKGKKDDDENARAVAGIVQDESEQPVEGAIVQLKDAKSLKVRSYITKADGVYKFFGLSTNADYDLRADFRTLASEKRTLSIFDSRKQAVINLRLAPRKKDGKVHRYWSIVENRRLRSDRTTQRAVFYLGDRPIPANVSQGSG